ncbi:hypothetical protein BDA99DRAFT_359804 [Phascolomyces articulosus]|uniref:F-box domain-containing protein n=1 Tax=Phascolomyces articulosus TaxID=60185 RepID=A0AAD5PG40_9FUNG|nr:hypothetical protein BDA99DRAFT_359804 [Phascolomyces articulosus]
MDKLGSNIFSSFKDITATSFIPFMNSDKNQNSSFNLIHTSPTSIEGYLVSGQEFEQRKDFLSALLIYNQGLLSVPPPSPLLSSSLSSASASSSSICINTKQYFQLQKAKRNALNRYMKKSREGIFEWSSLPNEVISLIFGYLDIGDLFVCTSICTEWFEFITDWSEFWEALLARMPHMSKETIMPIMRRQTRTFCLVGPMDLDVLHGILFCLACPSRSVGLTTNTYNDCCFVEELYFEDIFITDIGSTLLEQALRSIGPALKRVEFVNCETANNQVFKLFSRSPSFYTAAHVSISLAWITKNKISSAIGYNKYNHYTLPCDKEKLISNPTLQYLSYLKLSPIPIFVNNHEPVTTLQQIAQIIRRSPNLCELILDAEVPIDYGISVALKQNPYLHNLTVCSKSSAKIKTVVSLESNDYRNDQYSNSNNNNNDNNDNNNTSKDTSLFHKKLDYNNKKNQLSITTSTTNLTAARTKTAVGAKGLHTLIFSDSRGTKLRMHHNRCAGIFKKSLKTLEVLWICCDLNLKLFTELVTCGGPCLREINLSFLVYGGSRHGSAILLKTLFTKCPVLEAITIDSRKPGRVYCTTRIHSLAPRNSLVLMSIAQYCPRLRHLCIIDGQYSYPDVIDMDDFIDTTQEFGIQSKLTYLETNLHWGKALDTVQQLKDLKTLCLPIHTPAWPEHLKYPEDQKEQIQKILSERGGGLIFK